MPIKLQDDFDSKLNDISIFDSKEEINQSTALNVQRNQTRILYIVSSLAEMSYCISIALSAYILNQYIGKVYNENEYGMIDLSFYPILASTCASIVWGPISDQIGRKKALNISLIGSGLTMILFGFCKSFNSLAITNVLLNILSCKPILINTMVGESNCKISRPNAFRYLSIINMVAGALGPIITTPFTVPLIYDIAMEKDTASRMGFPYLIPSLIASGFSFAAYILSHYCLTETLNNSRFKSDGPTIVDRSTDQTMALAKSKKISIFGLNLSKNSLLLVILSSLLSLIYNVYSKISQDWLTMDSSKGGLNLKSNYILIVTPLYPIIIVTILLKYPYIIKNFGALKQFKAGFPAAGVLFILSIIATLIAKSGSAFITLFLYTILYSVDSAIDTLKDISFDLLLTESAEGSGNLGTLYGISDTLFGVISLMVQYMPKSLSTFPSESGLPFPLNYKLAWLLAVISLIGYWLSLKIETTDLQNQDNLREHKL